MLFKVLKHKQTGEFGVFVDNPLEIATSSMPHLMGIKTTKKLLIKLYKDPMITKQLKKFKLVTIKLEEV